MGRRTGVLGALAACVLAGCPGPGTVETDGGSSDAPVSTDGTVNDVGIDSPIVADVTDARPDAAGRDAVSNDVPETDTAIQDAASDAPDDTVFDDANVDADADPCSPGLTLCGGTCIDTMTSLAACGGCNQACAPANSTARCSAGTCEIATCNTGFGDCDNSAVNGCETPLDTTAHCGTCENACALANATSACTGGACAIDACSSGHLDCDGMAADGCEADATSVATCGTCTNACNYPGGIAACTGGICMLAGCQPGFEDRNGNPADGCEFGCGGTDLPDHALTDTNCDGIDGDASRAVYVSPALPSSCSAADGSAACPFPTIGQGISSAITLGRTQVLVAAGNYSESVTLRNGVTVAGGYSMPSWSRSTATTTITSTTGIGVTANNITMPTLLAGFDIHVTTTSTTDPSTYGIAVANGTAGALALEDLHIVAGDGQRGTDGRPGIPGGSGGDGSPGAAGCADCVPDGGAAGGGGAGGSGSCVFSFPRGGAGGTGGFGATNGTDGVSPFPGGRGGMGGVGQGAYACGMCATSPATAGANGQNGADGANGGNGAGGTGGYPNGTLWLTASGVPGGMPLDGRPGGGGGGGGGSGCCIADLAGGGGGGGGGGCLGLSGSGGTGGGGSFGLFLYMASPDVRYTTIATGNGGVGGNGAAGSPGGVGGAGGAGGAGAGDSARGGAGGHGGHGGNGGNGGGGAGGPSYGIYRAFGAAPMLTSVTITVGAGGAGGTSPGNPGLPGASAMMF